MINEATVRRTQEECMSEQPAIKTFSFGGCDFGRTSPGLDRLSHCQRSIRLSHWPETLVLYRTRPKHSECAGGVGAARRVRYSGLKEAAPGEAIMPVVLQVSNADKFVAE